MGLIVAVCEFYECVNKRERVQTHMSSLPLAQENKERLYKELAYDIRWPQQRRMHAVLSSNNEVLKQLQHADNQRRPETMKYVACRGLVVHFTIPYEWDGK